ncbi:type II toxin-antitoxin system RelE/ParE family toxin [Candidatus Peregrinibacteria bacterium]|nr:type II toxin-antitoxin system RelE/ParE family toxin [Candidatus Peregrinibacteria bacterium]
MHQIIYAHHARQDLKRLELRIAQRIIKKILFFSQQKNPLIFAKRLTNAALGEYRFRVGDYRILFDVDSKGAIQILMILGIKHRKDVYDL